MLLYTKLAIDLLNIQPLGGHIHCFVLIRRSYLLTHEYNRAGKIERFREQYAKITKSRWSGITKVGEHKGAEAKRSGSKIERKQKGVEVKRSGN